MVKLYSPVRRASRRGQIPDTTSPQCGHRLAFAGPLEPSTVRKQWEKLCCVGVSGNSELIK